MARLWSYGAELQSVAAGVEADTFTGTVSISTSTKRSGAASLRCNPTAGTGFVTHAYRTGSTVRTFFRTSVLFLTLPSADCALLANTDGAVNFPSIWYKAAGTCFQAKDGGPTFVGSTSAAITTGVWYQLQLDFNDASGDLMNAYVDGTQICTNVNAGDLGGSAQIRFGIITPSVTADAYFDDVAVNDSSGTAQNGLPGAGSIVHLYPNAAGDNNLWPTQTGGTAGSANNFTRVNQVTPDDATSFNAIAVTGTTQIDDFNVTDAATAGIGASDTITLVQVGHRAASAATTTASIVTRLKGQAGGTTTESASLPVNIVAYHTHATAAPKVHKITAYLNPQGAVAWTPTSISSMQIGYRANVAQTTTRRVTSVWALVEYVPVSTTPVTGTVDLRWAQRNLVTGALDIRWLSYAAVTGSTDLRWAVRSIVTGALDARWAVRSAVTAALDARWISYAQVLAALDLRWTSYAQAVGALDFRWAVRSVVSGSLDLRWALASSVTSAIDLRWAVWSPVTSALDVRWAVLAAVSTGMDLRWAVRSSVTSALDLRWTEFQQVSGVLDLRWASAGQVTGALDLRWTVRNAVAAPLDVRWALRAAVSGSLDLRWAARALVTAPLDLRWASSGRVTGVLALDWSIRGVVTGTLDARWAVRGQISGALDARWRIRATVLGGIQLFWVVEGSGAPAPPGDVVARLSARFAVVPEPIVLPGRPHRVTVTGPDPVIYRDGKRISAEMVEEL